MRTETALWGIRPDWRLVSYRTISGPEIHSYLPNNELVEHPLWLDRLTHA